jgi:transposase-like protein
MPTPTIARLGVEIKMLDADFRSYACPRCGTESPRHDGAVRHAIDLHLDRPVILQIKVGCYRCPSCEQRPCFRTPLPFLEPRCFFVTRARQKLVESIELDGMAILKAVKRLKRDFNVTIAPSTGWEWHRAAAPSNAAVAEYEQLVVASFSGVLVVDEVYDGGYAILCARDPLTGRTVAYQLCKEMNGAVMTSFFQSLKDIGIRPEVLVTDASPLYPKALAAVWSKCRHQLCRFHWVKDITGEVLRGIRDYKDTLPKTEKRARRGRPSKIEAKQQAKAAVAQSARDDVRKGRFLLLTRPENLDDGQRKRLADLLAAHPTLAVIRAFMVEFYGLFAGKPRPSEAKRRWRALVANPAYQACTQLAGALKPLADEKKFDKVCTYLKYENLNSTSNEVERDNRGFRRRQNAHYRLRDQTSIEIMLERRLLRDGPPTSTERLRKRFGRPQLPPLTNQLPEAKTA